MFDKYTIEYTFRMCQYVYSPVSMDNDRPSASIPYVHYIVYLFGF